MKPHNELTIISNRHRARELRIFRDLVDDYFRRSERDPDDVPVDWEGAQLARSRINQRLPRILQIVRTAGLGAPLGVTTDPGPALGKVDILQRIFTVRFPEDEQEILDLLDMALGIYDGDQVSAVARTFNPLHYAGMALGFLARGPRRMLRAVGLRRQPPAVLQPHDIARLQAIADRFANAEEVIDSRIAAIQDRLAVRQSELTRQLAELAERLDFAERVFAEGRPAKQLRPAGEKDVVTPV